ncbi:protein of unknown function [Candidatus Nitrotoga arctica]|uniref:Pentapeptide repeat-containing protein n=1 Tax=Candidatus Nitrotoga arctica TaxID=453162 RepID=A0ABN8ANH5_9PROT|nr:protein of unknown function [Candidatus Nitrotoga arctica]
MELSDIEVPDCLALAGIEVFDCLDLSRFEVSDCVALSGIEVRVCQELSGFEIPERTGSPDSDTMQPDPEVTQSACADIANAKLEAIAKLRTVFNM